MKYGRCIQSQVEQLGLDGEPDGAGRMKEMIKFQEIR